MIEEHVYAKLERIENEIEDLKMLVVKKMEKPKTVSLKGMATLLTSEEDLDNSIEKAKESLHSS